MIKCNQPYIQSSHTDYVEDSLLEGNLAMGEKVGIFESRMASIHQRSSAIAFSSATSAFDTYFEYILEPGDEVIISPFTFHSVIYSIIRAGGVPVVIDSRENGLADFSGINDHITPYTKAIVVTHLFGRPDDKVFALMGLFRSQGIKIIEDCAQAIGAKYMAGFVGAARCDASIFSFYATKNVTAVEGGILLTDNSQTDLAMRGLRNCKFVVCNNRTIFGTNRRMSDVHAAVGIQQLDKLEQITQTRNDQAANYSTMLGIDHSLLPEGYRHAYHHYTILVDKDKRYDVYNKCKLQGVELGMYYRYFAHQDNMVKDHMILNPTPTLDDISARLLQLPLGNRIKPASQEKVVRALRKVYDGPIIHAA